MNHYYLKMTETGTLVFDSTPNPSAPLQIELSTAYVFDDDVRLKLAIYDTKEPTPSDDLLHNLNFVLDFVDVPTAQSIVNVQGRLYTGGGIDELAEKHPTNRSYIIKKLDSYSGDDGGFFAITTQYDNTQAATIKERLPITQLSTKRKQERAFELPKQDVPNDVVVDSDILTRQLTDLDPDYIALTNVDDLGLFEVVASVVDTNNCHAFVELGHLSDHRQVVALANSLNVDDHRIRLLWNATVSRARGTTFGKKGRRPCVGDYLAKHLVRNGFRNNDGIPPLNIPIAGYNFPVLFNGIAMAEGVYFDAESENMLANAGVIVLKSERFGNQTRFVYADVLTQYDSENSALRLSNAAEIATYTAKMVIGIVKRHLLSDMTNFQRAYSDCTRFLNACVAAGLLVPAEQLNGKYYELEITPRADKPFEAVDIYLARRPVGAVRQAHLRTTVNK